MWRFASIVLVLLAGCYQSHERPERPERRDAGALGLDAGPRPDAGAPPDAGDFVCELAIVDTGFVEDPVRSLVTPRLAVLPSGDVALVYVSTDGSPTRVWYARINPSNLRLREEPVTVATDSFTWAEPVVVGDSVHVAYGLPGARSAMRELSFEGTPRGPRREVELPHPDALLPAADGIFWQAFETVGDNNLQYARVSTNGELLAGPARVETGRYGSGHGMVARPDGQSVVVSYPREGPPGIRDAWVSAFRADGTLEPERRLSEMGATGAYPVLQGDGLAVVRHDDDAMVLDRLDLASLALLETTTFDPLERLALPVVVRETLLVTGLTEGVVRVWDLDLAEPIDSLELTNPSRGPGADAVATDREAVYAFTQIDGGRSRIFLVRVGCELASPEP